MASAQAVYIKDRNSGLVFQYKPDTNAEVVIEKQVTGNASQLWLVIDSGVAGYIYIQSKLDGNVITGGQFGDPLIVTPQSSGLDKSQLWILQGMSGTNPNFVIMNANSGYVIDVKGLGKDPGTRVQSYERNNQSNQQFSFHA